MCVNIYIKKAVSQAATTELHDKKGKEIAKWKWAFPPSDINTFSCTLPFMKREELHLTCWYYQRGRSNLPHHHVN